MRTETEGVHWWQSINLLRVETDNKRRNVNHLLANADNHSRDQPNAKLQQAHKEGVQRPDVPDVPLTDKNPGMMDALRKPTLEDLGLQPSLQEILNLESKHVVETHLGLVKHTNAHKPADQRIAFE